VNCPHCQQTAKLQDYRSKTLLSLLGPITLRRAYYYCPRCGHGLFPWDTLVGLTPKHLTPAAEQVTTLAGTLGESFREAATQILPELAGLRLAESTVERTTEEAGQRLDTHLAQGRTFGSSQPWQFYADAKGRICAYVSVDATGVRQQGPGGSAAEGRMPYVGMVFNPVPEHWADLPAARDRKPQMQARYLAGLYSLEELGLQLRRQAHQVGMEQAELWIGLTDGGNGLEQFLQTNFPRRLIVILDFWHAASSLEELAKLWHPRDTEQAQALAQSWCHTLKHQGGARLLKELEARPLPARQPALAAKQEEVQGYMRNNVHRMDYPTYLANGWQIGSGAVESACKTVVGQRLKLAGMRWGADGTDAVCHLRALFKSEPGQWQAFWQRSIN
jgi:hypothetical protein